MPLPLDKCPPGWMRPDCMAWLEERGREVTRMAIEIGSYKGRSTTAILHAMPPGAVLYAVDNWTGAQNDPDQARGFGPDDQVYKEFLANMVEPIMAGRLVAVRQDSLTGAQLLMEWHGLGGADFVFIDADHRYLGVLGDIRSYVPLIRKGGLIAGHDYSVNRWPGVKQAVNEVFGSNVVVGPGSIWSVRLT